VQQFNCCRTGNAFAVNHSCLKQHINNNDNNDNKNTIAFNTAIDRPPIVCTLPSPAAGSSMLAPCCPQIVICTVPPLTPHLPLFNSHQTAIAEIFLTPAMPPNGV
jgi:hypothetical protein